MLALNRWSFSFRDFKSEVHPSTDTPIDDCWGHHSLSDATSSLYWYARWPRGADNPISDAASLVFGDTVGVAFLWVSVVSVLGVNAGTALVTPRRLAALSEQGEAPRVLSKRHSHYGTPSYSIALTGGAALFSR